MPAPVFDLHRGFYQYTSDDTTDYELATTVGNANAQTTPGTKIPPGTNPTFPRGWVPRIIYGEYTDSGVVYRTKVPFFDPTDPIWLGTVLVFTKGGQTFNTMGHIGEKRTYKGG